MEHFFLQWRTQVVALCRTVEEGSSKSYFMSISPPFLSPSPATQVGTLGRDGGYFLLQHWGGEDSGGQELNIADRLNGKWIPVVSQSCQSSTLRQFPCPLVHENGSVTQEIKSGSTEMGNDRVWRQKNSDTKLQGRWYQWKLISLCLLHKSYSHVSAVRGRKCPLLHGHTASFWWGSVHTHWTKPTSAIAIKF